MYIRPVHACLDEDILRQFIKENPLGLLTTSIPSSRYHKIQSSHIPFVLDDPVPSTSSTDVDDSNRDLGTLRCHVARANPQAKTIIEHLKARNLVGREENDGEELEEEVLILFNSPNQHYITPKFYKETKPLNGKVVPTWNYQAVQVYGAIRVHHDSNLQSTSDYLNRQISDLSNLREEDSIKEKERLLSNGLEGVNLGEDETKQKETGWKVSDAPSNYIEILKKAIIGIEIKITSIEGRFKMSQEMGEKDREGVVEGLSRLDSEASIGVAKAVEKGGR